LTAGSWLDSFLKYKKWEARVFQLWFSFWEIFIQGQNMPLLNKQQTVIILWADGHFERKFFPT